MAVDSTSAGPILPTATPATDPLEGISLQDFFHDWIVGLTGFANTAVIPRWQPEPPNITAGDWCAFGITNIASDAFTANIHHAAGQGSDEVRRTEIISLLISFYGSNADSFASMFRDGMQLPQNHETLSNASMGFVDSGDLITAPSLVKEKWLYRVDLSFRIRRQVVRIYAIDSLLSAQTILTTDQPLRSTTIAN